MYGKSAAGFYLKSNFLLLYLALRRQPVAFMAVPPRYTCRFFEGKTLT
jgi:hypothetical protein